MRHVTLIFALVLTLIFAAPIAAQETSSLDGRGFFSSFFERIDNLVFDLFSKDGEDGSTEDDAPTRSADDSNPIEPPTSDHGPYLDPHG